MPVLKKEGQAEAVEIESYGEHPTPLRRYLEAVARDEEPPASGEDGLAVTAICCAILDAAENGQSIELPPEHR